MDSYTSAAGGRHGDLIHLYNEVEERKSVSRHYKQMRLVGTGRELRNLSNNDGRRTLYYVYRNRQAADMKLSNSLPSSDEG